MKKLFVLLVLFAGFASASSFLILSNAPDTVFGSYVYSATYFGYTTTEDATTKTGGSTLPTVFFFKPYINCAVGECVGTPSSIPLGVGWGSADSFWGFIPAGNWTFHNDLKLTNAQIGKTGYLGVNVFSECGGSFVQLFYVQGTQNVMPNSAVEFQSDITTSQPTFLLPANCKLYFGYWLNTTTGFSSNAHRLELHTLGIDFRNKSIEFPSPIISTTTNFTELIEYLRVIGNNTYSLNSSVAYFNTTLLDIDNETDFLHNITLTINNTATATHNDTQSVLTILDSLNVTILNASIAQLINQTFVIEDYLTQIQNMLDTINIQVLNIAGNVTQLSYQIANLTGLVQTLNITNDIIVINNSLNTIGATTNNTAIYTKYTVKTNNKKNTVFCLPQQYVDWCLVI